MHFSNAALLALAASFQLVLSAPADKTVKINRLLRLVKTSEEDPGKWVTEDQKFELFTSKGIGFIDITDIKVGQNRLLDHLDSAYRCLRV